jgi:predicted RNase H-like nuclease (RuvC/YqgF family)
MPPKPKKNESDSGAHNPFVKASDYGKKQAVGHKKSNSRANSQDKDLMSTMMQRLTALEKVNRSLKSEIKEKSIKMEGLEKENQRLHATSNKDYLQNYSKLETERGM